MSLHKKGSKPASQSLTIRSAAVALLMLVVAYLDIDLDEGIITELMNAVIGLASIAGVVYGRVRATHRLR